MNKWCIPAMTMPYAITSAAQHHHAWPLTCTASLSLGCEPQGRGPSATSGFR